MSAYSGTQQKGAAAARRKTKRIEALTREARYERAVLRYAIDRGIPEAEARTEMRLAGHLEYQFRDFRPRHVLGDLGGAA